MPGARRVIDISGDGANNSGRPIAEVRDEAVAAGVTINGLPILWVEPGLAEHYRDEVIGGHGAFMIAIDDYEGFAEAIQRKLVSEIAGIIPSRFAARHRGREQERPLAEATDRHRGADRAVAEGRRHVTMWVDASSSRDAP
jgi:hypothetical protein